MQPVTKQTISHITLKNILSEIDAKHAVDNEATPDKIAKKSSIATPYKYKIITCYRILTCVKRFVNPVKVTFLFCVVFCLILTTPRKIS